MNEEVMFEIGNIIHVRKDWKNNLLTPKEITESWEYKQFKRANPALCKLAEEST